MEGEQKEWAIGCANCEMISLGTVLAENVVSAVQVFHITRPGCHAGHILTAIETNGKAGEKLKGSLSTFPSPRGIPGRGK
jgi:hypothetical protein